MVSWGVKCDDHDDDDDDHDDHDDHNDDDFESNTSSPFQASFGSKTFFSNGPKPSFSCRTTVTF